MTPPTTHCGEDIDRIRAEKAHMRAAVLARRDALSPVDRVTGSRQVIEQVLSLEACRRARTVAAYCSFGSELDTALLLAEVLGAGKTLALPRIVHERDALAFYDVRDLDRQLVANRWGIREPRASMCRELAPGSIDFILVPGVAFDAQRRRLGYGKAYYDKVLRLVSTSGGAAFSVAGAFAAQIVDRVPVEAHDIPVDLVVTERTILEAPT